MDTGQAISEAKKFRNIFKSFEHILGVLEEVHAAKGVLSDVKAETERLNGEIVKANNLLRSKEKDLRKFLEAEAETRRKVGREFLTMEANFQEDKANDTAIFKEEMEKNKKANEVQILSGETKLALIHSEILEAEGVLNGLKSAIEGLKEKVASV